MSDPDDLDARAIASYPLSYTTLEGDIVTGFLRIERPCRSGDRWTCRVTIPLRGLRCGLFGIHGDRSFGALTGALLFLRVYLGGRQKDGCVFLDEEGRTYDIESLFAAASE